MSTGDDTHGGPWADAWTSLPSRAPLREPTSADLCVVGAGLTGLTTALLAARDGHDVVVLDRRRVGAGTSGLTTGKITVQHGLIFAELVARHGEDTARAYVEANTAGMDLLVRLVDELAIECDLIEADAVTYTRSTENVHRIEDEVAASTLIGLPGELVHDAGLPFEIAAGARLDHQWHVHPGRLVAGLAAAAEAAGARVHDGTVVTGIDESAEGAVVKTPSGAVTARKAVVATLLPPGLLGGYFARSRASMSHGVAAVLPQSAPRAMTYSIDADGHSTRPWPSQGPEGLLVIGDAHGVGSRVDTQQAAQQVERWVQRHFPGADVHALWCAHDYVTPDRMPYVGTPFGHQNVHVATGFGKWGLTNGAAAALVVQDVLAGREARWRAAMNAGRIGDLSAVAKTVRDNLEIAAELVSGQVLRDTPRCTHLGCRLRWNSADDSWDCPCHGSRFAADGSVLAGPAVRPLDLPK